jgi:hypothetical protein
MVTLLMTQAHGVFAASDPADASNVSTVQQNEPAALTIDARAMSGVLETKASLKGHFFDGPVLFKASAGQVIQGPHYPYPYPVYPHHHRDGSIAAIMIGAATLAAVATARKWWEGPCWPAEWSACLSAR